jgi:hypothetical protein
MGDLPSGAYAQRRMALEQFYAGVPDACAVVESAAGQLAGQGGQALAGGRGRHAYSAQSEQGQQRNDPDAVGPGRAAPGENGEEKSRHGSHQSRARSGEQDGADAKGGGGAA